MVVRRWLVALGSMLVAFALPGGMAAQTSDAGRWSGQTAETLSAGRVERGLFLPLRWGVTEEVEVSAFPLAEVVVPNARLKLQWRDDERAALSTVHALAYPTPMLNLVAREGTGGLLPANSEIPPMMTLRNGVLATHDMGGGHAWTASFFVTTTPRFGRANFTTIDLPIVFPRTASYYTAATYKPGLELAGPVIGNVSYRVGVDVFVLPGRPGGMIVEQTGRLAWSPGPKFRAMVGYLATVGQYPFGVQGNVYPLFDLQFAWPASAPDAAK